eukprot:CAMPEP_0194301720 /NCGR_PEP_ID=MMETSP0169-20130528/61949_1 /TAXON_ID=218684 /ORGANISM="Corethron pennatum, Strain L29A3" /LENGTH=788 /DNA_ID=CAMNT_0039051991 /DNA_START=85 /DNA_END=2451 /DNA_ORIENTATION=-
MNKQNENKSAPAKANPKSFFQACSFLNPDEEEELARLSVGSVSASKRSFRTARSSTLSRSGSTAVNVRSSVGTGTAPSRSYASKGSFGQGRSLPLSRSPRPPFPGVSEIGEISHVRPPVATSREPFFKSQPFVGRAKKDGDAQCTTSQSSPTDVKKYEVQPSVSASSVALNSRLKGLAEVDKAISKKTDGASELKASISYDNPNDSIVALLAKIWELEITYTEVLETIDEKIREAVGEDSFLLKERLGAWRYSGKAVLLPTLNIEEPFVDGKLETYEDVVRLNEELLDAAEELSKNKESHGALRAIIQNYRCLQACIKEIFQLTTNTQDEGVSKLGTADIHLQTAKEVAQKIASVVVVSEPVKSDTYMGTANKLALSGQETGRKLPSRGTDIGTTQKFSSVVVVSERGKIDTDVRTANKLALSGQKAGRQLPSFQSFVSRAESTGSVLGKISTDAQEGQKFPSFQHFENIQRHHWLEAQGHQVWTLGVITLDTDNKFILTDGDRANKNISVWDLDTKKLADNVASHHESIYKFLTIKLGNGRQCFASAGYYDTTLRIWCLLSEEEIGKMEMGSKIRGLCTFTLEDGRTCVAAGCSDENIIQIWSAESYEKLESLKGHSGIVYCLDVFTFEEGGCAFMASGSDDGNINIWNLSTLKLISTLDNHMKVRITALTIYINSEGSRLLVSGNNEGRVDIWELNSNTLVQTLEEETGHYICSFALFSIEGECDCLAYGCEAGEIKIWDIEKMILMKTLSTGEIDNVEIILATTNKNGKACLLACDSSSTVKIWE